MKWLKEMIDRVNAGGISGEWATKSQVAASSAVDKLELPAIPDDAVVDLVGCLIDVTQPRCQACNDTGRITISVGGMALLSNVCECVKRDGKQRE